MKPDIRWKQRFENYRKATGQLREFLAFPSLSKLEKQGLVHCFEYSFELAWKTLKDYEEAQGYEVNSPRAAIQTAFRAEIIADGHGWIDALEKRNLMAHTYDEARAEEAVELIRNRYASLLFELETRLVREL